MVIHAHALALEVVVGSLIRSRVVQLTAVVSGNVCSDFLRLLDDVPDVKRLISSQVVVRLILLLKLVFAHHIEFRNVILLRRLTLKPRFFLGTLVSHNLIAVKVFIVLLELLDRHSARLFSLLLFTLEEVEHFVYIFSPFTVALKTFNGKLSKVVAQFLAEKAPSKVWHI